jgi:hypothetical protein
MIPREGWIKWKRSEARQILMDDLHSDVLPIDPADASAEEAWSSSSTDLLSNHDIWWYVFLRKKLTIKQQRRMHHDGKWHCSSVLSYSQ